MLAAGVARRFGGPKLLMPFGASTVLGSVVGALVAANVAPIIVVAGAGATDIAASLKDEAVQVIRNPNPARGMVSSVRVGVVALPSSVSRFLIALGDQPRIGPEGLSRLLREHGRSKKGMAIPTHEGRRGHPVVFDAGYRMAILALDDGQSLRDLIQDHRDDCVEVESGSDACLCDIDTREEYEDQRRREQGNE